MTPSGSIPLGEIPLALVSRRCSDGHRLRFVAALARLHIGLSHTPEFGDGSVVLRSGWRSFARATLRMGETVAKAAKAELIEHGGVRFAGERGQIVTVDGGETRVRMINRGICRLLLERLSDDADGARLDALAVSTLVAIDLYLRARHDGQRIEGHILLCELAESFDTDRETVRLALHRLVANGLLAMSRGRGRGQGLGADRIHYRLALPAAWCGYAAAQGATDTAAEGGRTSSLDILQPDANAPDVPALEAVRSGIPPASNPVHDGIAPGLQMRGGNPPPGPGVMLLASPPTPAAALEGSFRCMALTWPPRQDPTARRDGPAVTYTIRDAQRNCTPPLPVQDGHAPTAPLAERRNCTRPTPASWRTCAPQERIGDRQEYGQGEGGATTLPPIPPDHTEQLGISPNLWPHLQVIIDALTSQGVRLEPTPHLATVLRDLDPQLVLRATGGCRIEDAWDLRVALYRRGVRRSVEGLWHDDIEATLGKCDLTLRRVCASNTEARLEWLDLFARAGLRQCGVLALNDHLFPRNRVTETQPRYVRFFEVAVREWARLRAGSAHLIQAPKEGAGTARPAPPVVPPAHVAIDGEPLPRDVRDAVHASACTADELTRHRLWLCQWENVLVRCADGTVVCRYRSETTLRHLQDAGLIARIEEAVRRQVPGVTGVRSEAAARAPAH